MSNPSELEPGEATALVASAIRRLFGFVPEAQARQAAASVLRELEACGVRLVRESGAEPGR